MKLLTSFTSHMGGEGQRISYTYSEADDTGKLLNQNARESFIVLDDDVLYHINSINEYIKQRMGD